MAAAQRFLAGGRRSIQQPVRAFRTKEACDCCHQYTCGKDCHGICGKVNSNATADQTVVEVTSVHILLTFEWRARVRP